MNKLLVFLSVSLVALTFNTKSVLANDGGMAVIDADSISNKNDNGITTIEVQGKDLSKLMNLLPATTSVMDPTYPELKGHTKSLGIRVADKAVIISCSDSTIEEGPKLVKIPGGTKCSISLTFSDDLGDAFPFEPKAPVCKK